MTGGPDRFDVGVVDDDDATLLADF